MRQNSQNYKSVKYQLLFLMDPKNSHNSLLQGNQDSRQALRESIQKIRIAYQKLMIFEVFTSKINILTSMSPEANKLSKRALGVHMNTVNEHASSNTRAFSYVLILALSQNGANLITKQSVNNIIIKLKQNPPKLKNYVFCQKFTGTDMLEIFAAMQLKILELVEGGLQIHDIIKAYSSYLDLGSYFLRSILADMKFQHSDDFNQKMVTNQIFSILSEYLDLSYIINRNIYLFPDLKVFVASPDDKQFIFGKYYQNIEQLQKSQSEIRESTIQYINQMSSNHDGIKMSKMNFQVSMSQLTQSKFTDVFAAPTSSKAPTPEFGENAFKCFEQLLGFNSEEQEKYIRTFADKQIKNPVVVSNIIMEVDKNLDSEKHENQKADMHKNNFQDEMVSPAMTVPNKNFGGSAFYLHQFDFIHYANAVQRNFIFEKMCSQRVLMKGSSMVDQGKNFLNQINQLRKQKQFQMIDRDRDRRKFNRKNKQQTISAHTLVHSNQIGRYNSPLSQNAKSQKAYDNRSSSDLSGKKKKKIMKLQSDVYHLSIKKNIQQGKNETKGQQGTQSVSSRSKGKSNFENSSKQEGKQLKSAKTQPNFKYFYQGYQQINQVQRKKPYIMPRQSQLPGSGINIKKYESIKIPHKKQRYNQNQISQNIQQEKYYEDSFAKKKEFQKNSYGLCDGQNAISTFQQASSQVINLNHNRILNGRQEIKPKPKSKQKPFDVNSRTFRRIGQISRKILEKNEKAKQVKDEQKIIIPQLNGNSTLLSFGYHNKNILEKRGIPQHKSDGFITIKQQTSQNNQESKSHSKTKKNHLHIPSFLRKKEKNPAQLSMSNNTPAHNTKSKQKEKETRQKSKKDKNQKREQLMKSINDRIYSPHSTMKSIQFKNIKMEVKQSKDTNERMKYNIKGRVFEKQASTNTPAFGTPQAAKVIKKKE